MKSRRVLLLLTIIIVLFVLFWIRYGDKITRKVFAHPVPRDQWATVQQTYQDDSIIVERVSYNSSDDLLIQGQVCRPNDGLRHPVYIFNHGGWKGLGEEWGGENSFCRTLARAGYIGVESAYRGEDGSQGTIELCAGEVEDVLRITEVALSQIYSDFDHVTMAGGSHGGCITVRAVLAGAPVQRVLNYAGPVDWAEVYNNARDEIANGATGLALETYRDIIHQFEESMGGSPDEVPEAYAKRSPLNGGNGVDISQKWPITVLFQYGSADEIVPLVQGCQLGAAVRFDTYYVDTSGNVKAEVPADCNHIGLNWRTDPVPLNQWYNKKLMVIYEGLTHGGAGNPFQQRHVENFFSTP
jgi:dienelactone hydrolase